ncbi:MAG: porin [Rhodobacteraceae bacterium]|nr:porin [Paracoccaceae bacterium]MCZ8334333.1 porin [Paracoccaceae bacterium]
MKKVLLATTMLVAGASVAAAQESNISLSGDARLGIVSDFADVVTFNSRARVTFNLARETDSGLSFGATFRADNAGANTTTIAPDGPDADALPDVANTGGAVNGMAGNVFISGAFGRLAMGDLDGAANASVGQVAGVGYTGLGDLNEVTYIANGTKESALYTYTFGEFTARLSAGQLSTAAGNPWAIGVSYATDAYSVSLGYENNDNGSTHTIIGATGTFQGLTLNAIYGKASGTIDGKQYAVSASYTMDAITGTLFYADDSEVGGAKATGLGVSYDLGSGAAFTAGYAKNRTADTDSFDVGVTLSF